MDRASVAARSKLLFATAVSPARFWASARAMSASQRASGEGSELLGHLQTAGEVHRRLLEREEAERVFARGAAVVGGLVRVGQGRTHVEVMGQLVDVGVQVVGVHPLHGDGDLVVVAHSPPARSSP